MGVIFIKVWRNGTRRILFKLPEHFQGKIRDGRALASAGIMSVDDLYDGVIQAFQAVQY